VLSFVSKDGGNPFVLAMCSIVVHAFCLFLGVKVTDALCLETSVCCCFMFFRVIGGEMNHRIDGRWFSVNIDFKTLNCSV